MDRTRLLTETFLNGVELHASLGSTNDRAMELLCDAGLPVPFLVHAEEQFAGRGRNANRWWSATGALTFSVILEFPANLPVKQRPQLALVTGMAVCDALRQLAPRISFGVKWPNDVFANQRKICGILVEASQQIPERVVIGIGLNIGNSFESAPEEIRSLGTSLVDELGESAPNPDDTLIAILVAFERQWRIFLAGELSPCDQWHRYCVLRDHAVIVETPTGQVSGRCDGIDEHGALLVQTESGRVVCLSGTVRRL